MAFGASACLADRRTATYDISTGDENPKKLSRGRASGTTLNSRRPNSQHRQLLPAEPRVPVLPDVVPFPALEPGTPIIYSRGVSDKEPFPDRSTIILNGAQTLDLDHWR